MWFALECAKSYSKAGEIGKSLKKYHQVEKVTNNDNYFFFAFLYGFIFCA